jgi:hypothetical protein
MKRNVLQFVLAVAALLATGRLETLAEETEILLKNPGFEVGQGGKPVGWNSSNAGEGSGRFVERTRTGFGCFVMKGDKVYETGDFVHYDILSETVDVGSVPVVQAEVWVRIPEDFKGTKRGAILNLLGYDENGRDLHKAGWGLMEHEASVHIATDGWQRISVSAEIDEPALRKVAIRLGVCGKGTAYFDDVRLVGPSQEPGLRANLLPPIIHNAILSSSRPSRIGFWYRVWGMELSDIQVRMQLAASSDKTPQSTDTIDEVRAEEGTISLPTPPYAPGQDIRLWVEVIEKKTNNVLFSQEERIKQLPPNASAEVSVAPNGGLLVNGEPFFAIGFFAGPSEDFARMKELGVNVTGFYEQPDEDYLRKAEQHGMKVIFGINLPRNGEDLPARLAPVVSMVKRSSAFLGYYTADEPAADVFPALERVYRDLTALDPYHVVIITANTHRRTLAQYCDVMQPDEYPLPGDLDGITRTVQTTARECKPNKSPWFISQAFPWSVYGGLTYADAPSPTFDEFRAMTWLPIVEGAKGVVYYTYRTLYAQQGGIYIRRAYPLLWESLSYVIRELASLQDIPLMEKHDGRLEASDKRIRLLAKQRLGQLYLVAVNPSLEKLENVRISVEGAPAGQLKVLSEQRTVQLIGTAFVDQFLPRETHIYTTGDLESALSASTLELRARLSLKNDLLLEERAKNPALPENGARVSSSWGGFPPRGPRNAFDSWDLFYDGFPGTFWAIGKAADLEPHAKSAGHSLKDITTGERWIDIDFVGACALEEVNAVVADLDCRLALRENDTWVSVPVDRKTAVPDLHSFVQVDKFSFVPDSAIKAHGIRLWISPRTGKNEMIFEIACRKAD